MRYSRYSTVECFLTKFQFHQHFMRDFFHMKASCAAFLYLNFRFVLSWHKNIGAKDALKILVKLTTGVVIHKRLRYLQNIIVRFTNPFLHSFEIRLKQSVLFIIWLVCSRIFFYFFVFVHSLLEELYKWRHCIIFYFQNCQPVKSPKIVWFKRTLITFKFTTWKSPKQSSFTFRTFLEPKWPLYVPI